MRRRRAQDAARFSLFPFLAVLLCAMGSLIVLLLIVVQQSRAMAAVEQRHADGPPPADLLAEAQDLSAAAEELEQMRTQISAQLESSRLELSHLEDHIRRLRDQYARLEADYHVLQQSHQQDAGSRQQRLAELMRLRREIDKAKADLDAARRAADARPRSFAIIPYEGPQGTRRRPIYIECRGEQIIIHPEGVVLLPDDFQGPIDAGNPLAAALRATREYLAETGSLQGGEPYPLLLVRPEGAKMYAAAMAAMQSWSSEYGYELIDADMHLELPPADEALGDVVRRTVNLARQRSLAAARVRGTSPAGGRGGQGGIGPAFGEGGSYLSVSREGGFQRHGAGTADDWFDRHVAGPNNPALGAESSTDSAARSNQGGGGQGPFYGGEQPSGPHSPSTDTPAGGSPAAAAGAPSPSGHPPPHAAPQAPPHAPPPASSDAAAHAPQNFSATNRPGATAPPPPLEMHHAAGGPDGSQDAAAEASLQVHPQPAALSRTRGANWALPNSAQGATSFHRPVRVQCHADKLVVLPDRGASERAKVTPLSGPMQGSIDNFVADLWQHMNGWGMAGPQAYWKPVLSVEVAPGGESRFAELSALMQQSGVEVQRKK